MAVATILAVFFVVSAFLPAFYAAMAVMFSLGLLYSGTSLISGNFDVDTRTACVVSAVFCAALSFFAVLWIHVMHALTLDVVGVIGVVIILSVSALRGSSVVLITTSLTSYVTGTTMPKTKDDWKLIVLHFVVELATFIPVYMHLRDG